MRLVFAVLLFIASSGMIFAGYSADAPLPGLDYDIRATLEGSCGTQAEHGDRLMSFLSNGESESAGPAHTANKSTVSLLRYLACGLIDN